MIHRESNYGLTSYREGAAEVDVVSGRPEHGGQAFESSFRARREHRLRGTT